VTTETSRPSVLVVDDDETREAIAELLRDEGYAVSTAPDGAQALDLLRDHVPDLVLLDIVMPGTSGLDLLDSLRARYSSAELPVVMMSAKGQSTDVVAALGQGANDYVTKPLDLPVVLARVRAHLRTRGPGPRSGRLDSGATERVRPGTLLDGRYLLEEKIGTGSFGVVYRARDQELHIPVAVKVLRVALGDSRDALERLHRESRAAQELDHPHAVKVHELRITSDAVAFLVMELLEGHGLDVELRDRRPLSPERTAEVILPVCEVLAEAHARGMVHRDIKPANVFLERRDGHEQVKVLDFGLAKPFGSALLERNLTLDGSILGSPAYLAPERLRNQPYDGRADTYSVGVMLYEMVTGRLPFESSEGDPLSVVAMHLAETPRPPRELKADLSPALEALILQTLAKNPQDRPQAVTLGRQLAETVGVPPPAGLTQDAVKTLRLGTS
jgi:CheY-like chemotaxis protein